MTLFKYMSAPYTLFDDGYIRATQLSALNDPYEAFYCKKSLKELVKQFDISSVFDVDDGKVSFPRYVEKHKNQIGVISFTEAKDNLLMWAHYANEHKGIVAGFSILDFDNGMFANLFQLPPSCTSALFEHEIFNGLPKPVMYRKQPRYRIDRFDFDYTHIVADGADRILYEIFLQKSEEWIYEKEHRIILRLEQADKVRIFDIENLENEYVKNSILNSDWCTFTDAEESYYEITLMDIDDESTRFVFAKALANLSTNKNNVYLFKLKPNAISSCLLGLNSTFSYQDIMKHYVNSVGYYEVWKATQNKQNYIIEFQQLFENRE